VFAVLDTNQPYRSADIRNEPDYLPLFRGIVSHLSVPISFQDRCIGVIAVESPEPNAFTDDDQRVLEDLSRSIVILVRRAQLYEATRDKRGRHGILIRGLSPEWEEVERRVERAAATNATVILRGESGTGKELVANAVHFNSKRCRRPLVTVNSAAIPEALLESTLFGHVKGAFTGASYDRVGAFEQANGGTIFLDEIGDLSLPLQAKLLRVLQTGEIEKVGANEHSTRVDVRVIAATSRDLETMMADNEFREDLYYRLHVVPIRLPPLRRYKQSIPNMVKAFIAEAGIEHGRPGVEIETAALEALLRWDFPGNVRELKNMIERAVILCRNNVITLDDLPSQVASHQGSGGATLASTHDYRTLKQHMLDRFERTYLEDLMRAAHGNISRAAELSGLSRVHCYKLLKRYDVDVSGFRE
jgi:two-component system NtrC family response regulator